MYERVINLRSKSGAYVEIKRSSPEAQAPRRAGVAAASGTPRDVARHLNHPLSGRTRLNTIAPLRVAVICHSELFRKVSFYEYTVCM